MKRLLLIASSIFCCFYTSEAQQKDYFFLRTMDPVVETPVWESYLLAYSTDGYIFQFADDQGNWSQLKRKYLYTRNQDNKIISYQGYTWANSQWMKNENYECDYVVDSGVIKQTTVVYGSASTTQQYKNIYTYNNGILTNTFLYVKSSPASSYNKERETYYIYNAAGQRIKDSTWKNWNASLFYSYDNDNRCTLEVKRYNTPLSGIDTLNYSRYEYYPDGKLKKTIFYSARLGRLQPDSEYEYGYTSGGLINTVKKTSFDPSIYKSFFFFIYKHYYNSNNKLISYTVKGYDSTWKLHQMDSTYFPVLSSGSYDTAINYVWKNNQWKINARFIFDALGLSNYTHEVRPVIIYPNPAQSFITVELPANSTEKEISITDITGKTIRRFAVNNPVTEIYLDIPAGIYFLQAGNCISKFVKQ